MKELREIQGREGELVERRSAAQDQLRRIDLRAPSSGTVHQLTVHTLGGVLQPGEPAMLIVPVDEELQLDARGAPTDIDQISFGQPVRVKVQAGNQASNPELFGKVSRISADISRDERQATVYYTVRVSLPRSEMERLAPSGSSPACRRRPISRPCRAPRSTSCSSRSRPSSTGRSGSGSQAGAVGSIATSRSPAATVAPGFAPSRITVPLAGLFSSMNSFIDSSTATT